MPHRIKNTENIIGENSVFEGTIQLSGTLRIEGYYSGEDLTMEHIVIGKKGKVKSDLHTESVVVEGAILGNINSSTRAMLLPTAKILGNIASPELIIQNGVIWDGHCHINTNSKANVAEVIKNIFND
ncbi:MAG: bactofilin family protein [Brevinema sp.]